MPDQITRDTLFSDTREPLVEQTFKIEPNMGRSITAGVFDMNKPEPDYEIIFDPDADEDIGIAHERLDDHETSTFMLLYMFHNYGYKTREITIRRSTLERKTKG